MKSIRYVTNARGEAEPVALRSTQGLELRNANGDISSTAMGFQIALDTLTYIRKQVVTQKFYEIDIASQVPVAVGEGAFSQSILTNLEFSNADAFEKGNIRSGESGSRLAAADASVAATTIAVINWAKQIGYTIFDIEQALQANSWDVIMAKHRARKKNWDLGIQEIAFLGSLTDTRVTGLLTNANVTINTTFITAAINGLSAANFATFVQGLISLYYTATRNTAMPNRFVIPVSDYLGLQTLVPGTVGTYPISMLEFLLKAFRAATSQSDFQIIPNAYCDAANNLSRTGLNKQLYALYRHDMESVRMDIPVDYTTTQPNSLNNFSFQDVSYGQYTGVGIYRPLEVLYFRF